MNTFFKRLLQLVDNKGFKNLNDFALNGLKYDSSSKLNRLKDENKKPSVEIIEDIANKFQDLNLRWLILGEGEMLREKIFQDSNNLDNTYEINSNDKKIAFLEEQNELLKITSTNKDEMILFYKEKIGFVEIKLQDCENEKKLLKGSKPSL